MIKNILNVTGDLVLSNQQLGYEEVLESFAQAKSVTVVTFNVSLKRDALIEQLRGLDVPVRLITNIPSRWTVNKDGQKEATASVADYMNALNPDNFGPVTSVSFCFSNHSKVIMTDRVGYIGSANYADESARNWEFGIIIRDPKVLHDVATAVDEIEKNSVRYFGPAIRDSLAPLLASASDLRELSERLGEDFEKVQEQELKDAIEELRDAIANSDPAWSEGFDESGPVYGNIDEITMGRIEEWFDDEMCIWDLKVADDKLREAENGDIDLPFDNDGNPIYSAQDDMIQERAMTREGCVIKVQKEIPRLQEYISEIISQIVSVCNEISGCVAKISDVRPSPNATEVSCLKCGKPMVKHEDTRGVFLGCSGFPHCKSSMSINSEGKPRQAPKKTCHTCEKCGLPLVLREGEFGRFLSCAGYPECRMTVKVDAHDNPIKAVDPKVKCEACGHPMLVRKGSHGAFLGCSAFPKCRNTLPIPDALQHNR